jgi:hypothetical protein
VTTTDTNAKHAPTRGEQLYKLLHAAFHVADDCEENAQTGAVTYLGGAKGTNDLGDMGTAFHDLGLESHEDIREYCNSHDALVAALEAVDRWRIKGTRGDALPEPIADIVRAALLLARGAP